MNLLDVQLLLEFYDFLLIEVDLILSFCFSLFKGGDIVLVSCRCLDLLLVVLKVGLNYTRSFPPSVLSKYRISASAF